MPTNFPTQQQMHEFGHAMTSFIALLPWLALLVITVIGGIVFLYLLVTFCLRLLDMQRLLGLEAVFLELTPPALAEMKPVSVQKLYSVLHGLNETRPWADKLLQRKAVCALEITGSLEKGIRYISRLPAKYRRSFERDVIAHMPDVRIHEVDDYLPLTLSYRQARVLDFRQTNHFAYPLKTQDSFEDEDFVAYLTTAMTQLAPGEQIAFQIVVSPATLRATNAIRKKILNNEHLLEHLSSKRSFSAQSLFKPINSFLLGITSTVGDTYHGSTSHSFKMAQREDHDRSQAAKRLRPARTLSAFELELVESVNRKVEQPLFRANVRALVAMKNKREQTERANDIRQSLGAFTVPKYQSLKARFPYPIDSVSKYRFFLFKHRLPAMFTRRTCALSVSEVSGLYHFPHSASTKTENVVKSLSRALPAPLSLKGAAVFDLMLGKNVYHGATTPIGLTAVERERHIFMIGGTGSGKTTMLKFAAVQDMRNGKNIAVIDPHGDLAQELLAYVPEGRIKDVVYFNPDDLAYPIGLNVLELTPGLEGDELLREKDLVTESVVSMFRKIFSDDDTGGHRIEYVLRNAVQTALTIEGATLFTVYNLLNDPDYCKTVIQTLENEDLKNFWKNELGKAGGWQQVKMVAGITAKIGRFLFSASAKRILEQPKSTINFDEILDGKILICNLSKGLLGEDTSALFGISVLTKIQIAALRRARLAQTERKPFYLYVDEFQNFATPSFVQMLSESRKYKLFLTMAEQSTSQQDDQKTVNIILANVGTVICFRTGNPADERLMLPLFSPYIEEGDIANLPAYNFYMRVSVINAQEPFSGETLLLDETGSEKTAEEAVGTSRNQYAKLYVPPKPKQAVKKQEVKSTAEESKKEGSSLFEKEKLKRQRRKNTKPQ